MLMSYGKAAALALLATIALPASATTIENDGAWVDFYQIAYFSPLGQSFTAVDADLLSIGFNYAEINSGFENSAITIDLHEGAGLGGAVIASRTFTLANLSGWTDTDFSGVTLTVGQVYTAAVSTSSPLEAINLTADVYAGGNLYTPQQGFPADRDLMFRVVGASDVPEPVSWAMMVGGFGLIGGAMRTRRKAAVSFG
jgi:hypothetical protein